VWPDVGRLPRPREQPYLALQQFLQKINHCKEAVERLAPRLKIHQQVHIAHKRAERRPAQRPQLRLLLVQYVGFGLDGEVAQGGDKAGSEREVAYYILPPGCQLVFAAGLLR
jgi:hypothetical protein